MSTALQQTEPDTLTGTVNSQGLGEFLVFQLGGEEYALDILLVQEIRAHEAMTAIADTADYFAGVINLRGLIVPMIDMRIKFGFSTHQDSQPVAIILNTCERQIGILVDGVSEVIRINHGEIKAPPDLPEVGANTMIRGLLTLQQRILIILNFAQFIPSLQSNLVLPHASALS